MLDSLRESRQHLAGDPARVFELYREDALRGDPEAQAVVGSLYLEGVGVAHDPAQGLDLLQRAAEQGNAEAQAALGVAYDQGRGGIAKDPARAVAWYERAAALGNATARFNLAVIYRHGVGVPRDTARALMWLHLAREQSASAAYMLHALEGELSADELRAGRELAQHWQAEHSGVAASVAPAAAAHPGP
jgi:TPR repeat protein